MMRITHKSLVARALLLALGIASAAAAFQKTTAVKETTGPQSRVEREVRHELVTLPFYNVFDNLAFRVDGGTVTLLGQVTNPVLKDDAERAVKNIEGVERVRNEIEVLPLSPEDDRIRREAFRMIYGDPALSKYALQAIPPIHIIVKNGHIDLEGVVANEMDKTIAGLRANQVPGAFSVTNNLRVESRG